jgi:cytochrome c biogenesis protein ResB
MYLKDVSAKQHLGTTISMSYSSDLWLSDPSRSVDQAVRVWMNNPLRYGGQNFYQSGYERDSNTGMEMTTLQVVTNTGWMIPYVACMIVATGMTAQFWVVLGRFLRRR